MFCISRLTIEKFRNVEPLELEFGPGFVLLLGKNGTGKTTLLDLVAGVASGDMRSLRAEQSETRLSWSLAVADGESLEFSLEGSAGPNDLLRSTIVGPLGSAHAASRFTRRPEALTKAFGSPLPASIHAGLAEPDRSIHGGRFDEALDFFWFLARGSLSDEGAVIDESAGAPSVVTAHWEHTDHERLIAAATANDGQVSWTHDTSRALADLPRLLGVASVTATMTRLQVTGSVEHRRHVYSKPSFDFSLRDGTSFLHDRLSFGQKRLFAFAHYMEALRGRPAVCDELANGFHYDWIVYAFEKLARQQAFLSSQNPILLDRVTGLDDVADVRRAFITCRMLETKSGARTLRWANATEEEAEAFLRGYRTGIAHVSEVLRDKELW